MLYKFRGNVGIDNDDFLRDVKMIKNDEIWCSNIRNLNDPTEASFSLKEFKRNLTIMLKGLSLLHIKKFNQENIDKYEESILKLMDLYLENCGVYSLAKRYSNELMWAHYGNSHKGFCIEYNFSDLKEFNLNFPAGNSLSHLHRFEKVNYSDKIFNINNVNVEYDDMIRFLFFKSNIWKYEEEYRIVTNVAGKFKYNGSKLKSITFGLNMNDLEKYYLQDQLKDKDVHFYQMKRKENEFKFYRENI